MKRIVIPLVLGVLIGTTIAIWPRGPAPPMKFDRALWIEDREYTRARMVEDLVATQGLEGMAVSKVKDLLGEPDIVDQSEFYKEWKGSDYIIEYTLSIRRYCNRFATYHDVDFLKLGVQHETVHWVEVPRLH